MLVYLLAPHYSKNCKKKLFNTGCGRVSSRGLIIRDQCGGWGGKGRIGNKTCDKTICDKTHASQRYLQAAEDLRCCSWCFEQIFEDRESFLLQRKCAMSASVEIIFFWAWLIILVWENEPKLKETTVNYFEFRHHSSIEEYTSDGSELVNQDVRIVWASLISSLEVARYDCLPHHFFPNVSTSSVSRKN